MPDASENPDKNAQSRLIEDVEARLDYFRREYDLTYCKAVGALEIVKEGILLELFSTCSEDD